MAIKLDIYLKRTEQSLKDWLRTRGIEKSDDLSAYCSSIGLAASPENIEQAKELLEKVIPDVTFVNVEPEKKQKKKRYAT